MAVELRTNACAARATLAAPEGGGVGGLTETFGVRHSSLLSGPGLVHV